MKAHLFSRTDKSLMGKWWWSVDRWLLASTFALMIIGIWLSMSASPMVAERIGFSTFYFTYRHFLLIIPALALMVGFSLLDPKTLRRLCLFMLFIELVLLILTPLIGHEVKGGKRWVNIFGFSLQVSEFIKPTFAVATAWLLANPMIFKKLSSYKLSFALLIGIVGLIMMQPDFGMAIVITSVFLVQLFLAGLPMIFVWLGGLALILSGTLAYFFFPHVASRIDRFLDPAAGDRYQINHSLDSFVHGGLGGVGPGEGTIKKVLPDVHADFIFAVAGEEFGLIMCLLIVGIFAFIIVRGFYHAYHQPTLFPMLALAGLISQFGIQAFINIASTLHLIPTKGMTLPFISYGGSSLLAIAMNMGMVLGFTKVQDNKKARER